MDEQTIKRDLIRVCHLMYERSYVVSSDGNVSVRLDDGRILATPTMTCKGRMSEDQPTVLMVYANGRTNDSSMTVFPSGE